MLENQIHKFKIKKSLLTALGLWLSACLDEIFSFFSLRKTKRYWGIVYDSVSKQPLDPVIVKLLYADGREVETCVTDLAGRYGFLARPGKFKIFARKTNYVFPSKYVPAEKDGIYENLYHGQFFILHSDSEVVAPNIPMDPVGFDWNQQAKQNLQKVYAYWKLFIKRLIAVAFWFGLFFGLLGLWAHYPKIPAWLVVALALYLFLIIMPRIMPETRLWGKIKLKDLILDTSRLYLELRSSQFPDIIFGKAVVHEGGRFLLRANKGSYLLTLSSMTVESKKILLASLPVKVGKARIFNGTIVASKG